MVLSSHRSRRQHLHGEEGGDGGLSLSRRNIENEVSGTSSRKEAWTKTFYKWLITIDGDVDISSDRGYRRIPEVTNYAFFCGGRLRTVKHTRHLSVLVGMLIAAPMVLFSVFEANELWNTAYGYKPMVFFFYYFWAMGFSFFIRTATSDPGVLPKNIHLSQGSNPGQIPQEYRNIIHLPTPDTEKNPNSKIELKYCVACRIWRPPRASHCSTCGVCVEVHDHHCIWVNNCIGKRNYRYFIIFISGLVLAAVFLIANTIIHISRHNGRSSEIPVTILLLTYGTVFIWYPVILLLYHIAMAGTQQTTREFLKRVEMTNPVFAKITTNEDNPFDTGSFLRNLGGLMLQCRGLSYVNTREKNEPGDWRYIKVPQPHTFERVNFSTTLYPPPLPA